MTDRLSDEEFDAHAVGLTLARPLGVPDAFSLAKLLAEARRARKAERTLDRDLQMTAARLMACEDDIGGFRAREKALEEALEEAASSLECLSVAGSRTANISDLIDARGYAGSRAREARAALQRRGGGG